MTSSSAVLSVILKLAVGPVRFIRAEWHRDTPWFVLLRYEINDKEQEYGVRLDLDKRMIMDDLNDSHWNAIVQENTDEICDVVVRTINQA